MLFSLFYKSVILQCVFGRIKIVLALRGEDEGVRRLPKGNQGSLANHSHDSYLYLKINKSIMVILPIPALLPILFMHVL